MSATDEFVAASRRYAEQFTKGDKPMPPGKRVAVVACMDARIETGRLLGTTEIVLIHHTDCGMLTFRDDALKTEIEADTGLRPPFALEAFADPEDDIRQSVRRIKASPFVPHRDKVRGFVFDVATGRLNEVA